MGITVSYLKICLNDILSKNGTIDETIIYRKLKNKKNWIAETNILKAALSKEWKKG